MKKDVVFFVKLQAGDDSSLQQFMRMIVSGLFLTLVRQQRDTHSLSLRSIRKIYWMSVRRLQRRLCL